MPRKKGSIINKSVFNKIFAGDSDLAFKLIYEEMQKYNDCKRYNRSLRDYSDKIKASYTKLYDNKHDNAKKALRKSYPDKWKTHYNGLKLEVPYRNRRIKAVQEIAAEIAEKYESKYPDICLEDEFCKYCSFLLARSPDSLDKQYNLTLAAAIFILDSILKSNNFERAVYFIPHDERIDDIQLPYGFHDSVFSNNVIKGVMYLIMNRHGSSETFWTPETVVITSDKSGFYDYGRYIKSTDDGEEYYRDAEKLSVSQRYYALISFIHSDIIEHVINGYKNLCFEIVDIVLEQINKYHRKEIELTKKIKRNVELLENLIATADQNSSYTKPLSDALNYENSGVSELEDCMKSTLEIINTSSKISDLTSELESYKIKKEQVFKNLNVSTPCKSDETEDSEKLRGIEIKNPYNIAFSVLYLIDYGDNFVWIPQISGCLCSFSGQLLPWNPWRNDELFAILDEQGTDENISSDNGLAQTFDYDDDETISEYSLKYNDAYIWHRVGLEHQKDKLVTRNLAQILYIDSGVVPPRYQSSKFETAEAFIDSGFTSEEAEFFRFYKEVMKSAAVKYDFYNVQFTEERINARIAEEKTEPTVKELSDIISLRNKEIEELNSKLYSSGKEVEKLNETIRKMKEQSSEESKELYELRELIYKLQNDSENDSDTEETGVTFPYKTAERVVVYGGHATWLKVIVKLLPNVKFIDPYDTPDVNLIRNADVVWMQTNAMPHNKYSKIMEIVRSKKIPVKYFGYASAEKCAVQLAQYDKMKLTSNLQ